MRKKFSLAGDFRSLNPIFVSLYQARSAAFVLIGDTHQPHTKRPSTARLKFPKRSEDCIAPS